MDTLGVVVMSVLGGGLGVAIFQAIVGRRKSRAEVGGLEDGRLSKWQENALGLSAQILAKDKELNACLKAANTIEMERDRLADDLRECLEKVGECKCEV